jgi:hypothetical protein
VHFARSLQGLHEPVRFSHDKMALAPKLLDETKKVTWKKVGKLNFAGFASARWLEKWRSLHQRQ